MKTNLIIGSDNMSQKIVTDQAPAALGPYSQAVLAGNTLYGSGQVGLDPTTGKLAGTTIDAQAKQVFKNIKAVLAAADLTPANVVKTLIFLQDVNDFQLVNQLYADFFADNAILPARSCVEVAKLPAGALIEIEYTAVQ